MYAINSLSFCCLIITVFVSGCALSGSTYYPVTDSTPRRSTLGFSITPPPGKDWFERHQENSLYYLKRTRPQLYSISTKATEIHVEKVFSLPEDFHEYVKSLKEFRQPPVSYRNIEFSYADIDDLSLFCVGYSKPYENHGGQNAKGQAFFRVEKTGILCMHPESPQDGIDMYYMERSLSASATPFFQKEGEQFLSSLKFLPVVNEPDSGQNRNFRLQSFRQPCSVLNGPLCRRWPRLFLPRQ